MGFLSFAKDALLKRGLNISITKAFSWTGYTNDHMDEWKNLIKLIDAICVAWDNPAYYPEFDANGKAIKTHCNRFVNAVAKSIGCNDLHDPETGAPYLADQMIEIISNSSNWHEMRCAGLPEDLMKNALRIIQLSANQGSLLVAAASSASLGAAHGHICIVRPGLMKTSGKWGDIPVVANCGRENFIGRAKTGPMKGEPVGINQAFVSMPRFYCWKGA